MSTDLESNIEPSAETSKLSGGESEPSEEVSPDEAFRKKMESELNDLLEAWKNKFVHVFTAVLY